MPSIVKRGLGQHIRPDCVSDFTREVEEDFGSLMVVSKFDDLGARSGLVDESETVFRHEWSPSVDDLNVCSIDRWNLRSQRPLYGTSNFVLHVIRVIPSRQAEQY